MAYGWYLDRQAPLGPNHTGWFWEDTWAIMYSVDPSDLPADDDDDAAVSSDAGSLLGGEANMWSEQVSDANINSRIWPRACAIGERLWSSRNTTNTGFVLSSPPLLCSILYTSLHRCTYTYTSLN